MLQVGRGMSYDEDKVHFSMWCMLNSPLLAGNDLRKMSEQTLEILTNKELIALNQDPLGKPAEKVRKIDDCGIWVKPLYNGDIAIAVLNRSEESKKISLNLDNLGFEKDKTYSYKDLWSGKEIQKTQSAMEVNINAHGIVVYRFEDLYSAQ